MARHKGIPTKGRGNLYDSDEDEFSSSSFEDSYSVSPDTAARYMYDSSRADSQRSAHAFVKVTDKRGEKLSNTATDASFITPDEFPDNDESIFHCEEAAVPNGSNRDYPTGPPVFTYAHTPPVVAKKEAAKPSQIAYTHSATDLKSMSSAAQRTKAANNSDRPGPTLNKTGQLSAVSSELRHEMTPLKVVHSSGDLKQLAASTPSKPTVDVRALLMQAYEARSVQQQEKPSLNVVIIGHVDAGKSTLMGHLLYRLGEVDDRQMTKYQREAQKMGKASFAFAWVLDQTEEERSRGVTMDIAQTAFETQNKRIVVLDAPGHRDFIPRMITGTAQADAAVLVVNATRGEFESGFSTEESSSSTSDSGQAVTSLGPTSTSGAPTEGQTREHAILARALGINQFLVAVNKMDTVDWSQERFTYISTHLEAFLRKLGAQLSIQFCPVSGLEGTNVFAKVADEAHPLRQWYNGPCLLDCIDSLQCPGREVDKPFRFCVSDVFKPQSGTGCCLSGRVESGGVASSTVNAVAARVVALPSMQECSVKSITRTAVQSKGSTTTTATASSDPYSVGGEQSLNYAFAGDFVTLQVLCAQPDMLEPGCVLSDPMKPAPCTDRFKAQLLIVHIPPRRALCRGFTMLFHCQSVTTSATLKKLHRFQGRDGKQKIELTRPRVVTQLGQLEVTIVLDKVVCLEPTDETRALGRFTLRSNDRTIAGGNVTKILSRKS